jgi:hypothetical protein
MGSNSRTDRPARILTVVIAAAIFLSPAAWAGSKYKVLHNFGSGNDGAFPSGPLLFCGESNLCGDTGGGGTYGYGRVFELIRRSNGTWDESAVHDFADKGDGADPVGDLVSDSAGDLYGTLAGAGPGQTAVFKLEPGSGSWSLSLPYDQGNGPGLVLGKSGDLYGFFGNGRHQAGGIAELSPGSEGWTYTLLYSFCSQQGCEDGEGPSAPPSWDNRGNLYGTTLYGGNSQSSGHNKFCQQGLGCGVVFRMTPNGDGTWTYHVLHRFANFATDGQNPDGGLVVDASGNAYGVTAYGGVNGNGTVFEFSPSSDGHWKQSVLYDFPNCADGCLPGTTMVFDKAGNLYGTASGGVADCGGYTCGVVFKLTPQKNGKWNYSVLHKFNGSDGGFVVYGVILDEKGNLYGTTQSFGKYNAGVAFEITP